MMVHKYSSSVTKVKHPCIIIRRYSEPDELYRDEQHQMGLFHLSNRRVVYCYSVRTIDLRNTRDTYYINTRVYSVFIEVNKTYIHASKHRNTYVWTLTTRIPHSIPPPHTVIAGFITSLATLYIESWPTCKKGSGVTYRLKQLYSQGVFLVWSQNLSKHFFPENDYPLSYF